MDRLDEIDFLLESEHRLSAELERVHARLEVVLGLGEQALRPTLKLVVDNTKPGPEGGPAA